MSKLSKIRVGLDAVNIQDKEHLRQALVTCDDPIKAISDFQEENSILLPTLKPVLNLLDLHNVKRLDFHSSIADELKDQLVKRVEDLAASVQKDSNNEDIKKLEELLDKSFPLICMPRLTSFILLIMKSLPNVNESYLSYLNENEQLYSISPIEVKRQIWSFSPNVFYKELKPHFDKFLQYFDELITNNFEIACTIVNSFASLNVSNIDSPLIKDSLLLVNTAHSNFFRLNKRHATHVNDIVKLIGTSNKLYQYTINLLHTKYLKEHNWFYSTLKSQILIKINELHNHDVAHSIVTSGASDVNGENLNKFASIINSCLKEKKIETKRAKELEAIMESKKFEKIIPDIAFILADPFVIDMLSRNAISLLNRSIQSELLPRNCTELIFVLRLLSLGLTAKELMESKANKEPKMDAVLITVYLPKLAYFLTDFCEKLYDDSLESVSNLVNTSLTKPSLLTTSPTITTTPTTSAMNPALVKKSPSSLPKISSRKLDLVATIRPQLDENELSSVLLVYLVIGCFEINDWINLKILLPELKYPANNHELFQKWFLHQFFQILNEKSVLEQFKNDWFVKLIFDEFLLPILKQSKNDSTLFYEQVLKLVEKIYPSYLSASSFLPLIGEIKPNDSHPTSLHCFYVKLKQKVEIGQDKND